MEFKETLIMIYVPLVCLFPNDQNRFRQQISAKSVIGMSPNIWPRYATPCQGDQSYLSFSVKMNPDERVLGANLCNICDWYESKYLAVICNSDQVDQSCLSYSVKMNPDERVVGGIYCVRGIPILVQFTC
ncbi:hypothetical protein CDAR_574761 [Caerostris darwini]|uniref:Uncharacterized protein n=1 Tax=Caerostris darwini TaxID=1538125 RepID=A0AAV4T476_9ARAC|nr:hypothetical protein CDAR_574761 [Caerostris darwini]